MKKDRIQQCECCKEYFRDGTVKTIHGKKVCLDCYKFIKFLLEEQYIKSQINFRNDIVNIQEQVIENINDQDKCEALFNKTLVKVDFDIIKHVQKMNKE